MDAPTEFIMPYPVCPKCGVKMQLDKTTYDGYEGPLTCSDCLVELDVKFYGGALGSIKPRVDPVLLEGIPKIPPACFRDYRDAVKCFSAGVPKAAAVMCRFALQHGLAERGVTLGNPDGMIAEVLKSQLLTKTTIVMLKDATWIAGKAGHPQAELEYDIQGPEARHALDLTKRILFELFPGVKGSDERAEEERVRAALAELLDRPDRPGPTLLRG